MKGRWKGFESRRIVHDDPIDGFTSLLAIARCTGCSPKQANQKGREVEEQCECGKANERKAKEAKKKCVCERSIRGRVLAT